MGGALAGPGAVVQGPGVRMMGNLKDRYALVGVGLTKFGKIFDKSPIGFTLEGIKRAVDDAGLTRDDIDGLLVAMPAMMGEEHAWAARIGALLELPLTFSATMDAGGATPVVMVQTAALAIEAGMCRTVVCAYGHSENPQARPLPSPTSSSPCPTATSAPPRSRPTSRAGTCTSSAPPARNSARWRWPSATTPA